MRHNCTILHYEGGSMAAIDIEKKIMATPKPDQC